MQVTYAFLLAGLGVALVGLSAFLFVSGHFFSRTVAWILDRRQKKRQRPAWATFYLPKK